MSKYLTYHERLEIQAGLKQNLSFGEIALSIGKDRTTVAKEIKRHSKEKRSGYSGFAYNACRYRGTCKAKYICDKEDCKRPSVYACKLCGYCNEACTEFKEEACISAFKPPYVCNGCEQLSKCTLKKFLYDAEDAHIAYSTNISEARSGILSSEDELYRLNSIISPLVRKGQSVHQIYATHVDELMCSEKTIYNYIDARLFDVRNIDLPRKVKYRPRYKKPEFKVDKGCRVGRNYQDFLAFTSENPDLPVVQMDTLIGSRGGKVILTVHFVHTSLMLAFLRERNTSQSVIDIFAAFRAVLGAAGFKRLFPVILTDNGSEFSNPKAIEHGPDGLAQTRVFYCDPSSPHQKGAIEVNHELIRRVLPKGSSFDNLTQDDVNLMMNHINSYRRKKLNDHNPFEAFSFYYGEDFPRQLGCSPVAAEDIILKQKLLRK